MHIFLAFVVFLLITLLTCVYFLKHHLYSERWRLLARIPGHPARWITGHMHLLDDTPAWPKLSELADIVGPIMYLRLVSTPVVVLNSYEAIYEGLVTKGKKLLTRPLLTRTGLGFPGHQSVLIGESDDRWRLMRRSFLLNFKFYGSGKSHLEPIILELLGEYITKLNNTNGQPFDPRELTFQYFGSVMAVLNFGRKPDSKDFFDMVRPFDQLLAKYLNPVGNGVELDVYDFWKYTGLCQEPMTALNKVAEAGAALWKKYAKTTPVKWEDKPFNVEEGRIREPYFAGTLKTIVSSSKGLGEVYGQGVLSDAFAGGLGTSTNSLTFLFNILCHYPNVQDKLHEEVDTLGGPPDSFIGSEMKESLHYVQATLYELLRYTSIVPFGFPHKTMEEVILQGYRVPADTIVLANTWHLHHSEEYFPDPYAFKPERYLDVDGRFVSAEHPNRRHLLPFGAGNRVCAGKILALNRYFITIANLMKKFKVIPDREMVTIDPRESKPGIFIGGHNFKCRFIPRQ